MGTLIYGPVNVDMDDRLLAHLQIVIVNKLRRGEPLLISWLDDLSVGDGRSSVWVNAYVPLYFKFTGSRSPAIDEEWLHRLTESADSSRGLILQRTDGSPIRAAGFPNRGR